MHNITLKRKEKEKDELNELESENLNSSKPIKKKKRSITNELFAFLLGVISSGLICLVVSVIFFVAIILDIQEDYNYDENTPIPIQNEKIEAKKQFLVNFMTKYCAFDIRDEEEYAALEYQSILNMFDDDYAVYYTPEEKEELMESNEDTFKGIGISYVKDAGINAIRIANVYEGGPADRAGLQVGDLIISINGTRVSKMDTTELAKLLKDMGDDVTLNITITRLGEAHTYSVDKEIIEYDYIDYELLEGKVPYIKLIEFNGNAGGQVREAILAMQDDILEMNTLVLDLRGNPGGLITEAEDVLGCFVGPDKLLAIIEQKSKEDKKYYTTGEKVFPDGVKLYVLIDGSTASASELVTCALQDYELDITTIGDISFGKGIAQTYKILSDGSAFKYTEGLYYSPKRRNIHEVGIIPDIEVIDEDEQMEVVLDLLGIRTDK